MHNLTQAVQSVPLETMGGLITLTRPENTPEGASTRNYDMDFLIGSAQTRPPLENVYSYESASSGPNGGDEAVNVGSAVAWTNPTNVLANDGSYAQCIPGSGSDALAVTAFAFNLPVTVTPTGITVTVKGWGTSTVTLKVQLLLGGMPVGVAKTMVLPLANGVVTLGTPGDLWGAAVAYSDVNAVGFGIQITASSAFPGAQALLDYVSIQIGQTTANANFNFIAPFVAQDGTCKNFSLDANGNFWVEDVTNNPGVLTLVFDGATLNSFASGVNGPDVEYLAFNDLTTGCDIPRQVTSQWTDRISQVGPGASPNFAATSASATTYAITSITQPAPGPNNNDGPGFVFAFGLQSQGPGNTTLGNVITIYYSDSTLNSTGDTDLINAFNSGYAVYLYVQMTDPTLEFQSPNTVQVTSVGLGTPPGQSRPFYYFTYVVPTQASIQLTGQGGFRVSYNRTLAKLTTSVPVPLLTVGSSAVVSGSSIAAWDATWPITQALNSGSMAITQTSLTGGVAIYSYAVVSGQNPTVGQLITITGTLNANGALNVVNGTILSVSGATIGTFTVGGFSAATDYPAEAEDGSAITAGTEFAFDPGVETLGSMSSPIFGNATGGELFITGTGQFIGAGTRQGVVFFITRNGYYTAPGPPITFTTPDNTTAILASQIPIGPPNVIARGIAFTEAGQNGVPGANFFTIPEPVQYIVENVTYTATALIINDNTSTSASFFFTDSVLLNAEAIDIQGSNLFNLIEIGNPGWIVSYAARNFYGLCQNKIQNFTNLSFDGGYLPGVQLTPLGWTNPDQYGMLLASPVFGNSYYIKNSSGGVLSVAGLITQTAYQDAYLQPILNINTLYSVRVTARIPSGNQTGSLVVALVANGIVYGSFTLSFAALSTSMATFTGTLLLNEFDTVPTGLQLQYSAIGMGAGADVEADRIEVFPTNIPVLTTTVYGSYAADLESVDAITGAVKFTSENQEPVNGAVVMYDTFYGLKQSSQYSLQSSPNLEPAQWNEPEVAQRAGACGINAYDFGEQWLVEACRNGLYLFDGGQPGKIMQEIYQVWDAINWQAGKCIWVRNDVPARRLYVGVPLPTPNFWLPKAPVNPAPTSPNVILMLNYQGCESGDAIKNEMQLHTTMFGTLNATDMKRKWSIWQIASPYAAAAITGVSDTIVTSIGPGQGLVTQILPGKNVLNAEVRFCNGIKSSKIYRLNENLASDVIPTDDGATINSLYTTYGYVNTNKTAQMPLLGLFRKLWTYMTHQVSGVGTRLNVRLLPNTLLGPNDDTTGYYPWTLPGGFPLTDPCTQVHEAPLNFAATRTYVEFSTTGRMVISDLVMTGRKHPQNALTGQR